jgi:hypothetical protein
MPNTKIQLISLSIGSSVWAITSSGNVIAIVKPPLLTTNVIASQLQQVASATYRFLYSAIA